MPENKSQTNKDESVAADERPVPSQAEGDRETIEEDLAEKEKAETANPGKA